MGKLDGETICLTGKFSVTRPAMQKWLESHGATAANGVTKQTTMLLCQGDEGSAKCVKAEGLGIPIHDEAWIRAHVGGDAPAAAAKPAKKAGGGGGAKRKREDDDDEGDEEAGGGGGGGGLAGKVICLTGRFSKPKAQLEAGVHRSGGEISNSVTKKTTDLVCAGDEGSAKYAKAEELGIPIHDEDWLVAMIGGGSAPPPAKKAKKAAKEEEEEDDEGGDDEGGDDAEGGDEGGDGEGGAGAKGKVICLTGRFSRPKAELEAGIHRSGGSVSGTVTKKTTDLVCAGDEGSAKYAKAEELGIPIHDEDWLVNLIGGGGGKKAGGGAAGKFNAKAAAKRIFGDVDDGEGAEADDIKEMETKLGKKLPPQYVALVKVKNGGDLKLNECPCPDHPDGKVHIGELSGVSDGTMMDTEEQIEEWGLPKNLGLVLLGGEGHEWWALSYKNNACSVVYLEEGEPDWKVYELAPDFEQFVAKLRAATDI